MGTVLHLRTIRLQSESKKKNDVGPSIPWSPVPNFILVRAVLLLQAVIVSSKHCIYLIRAYRSDSRSIGECFFIWWSSKRI
jgi:hypothetical protein